MNGLYLNHKNSTHEKRRTVVIRPFSITSTSLPEMYLFSIGH